MSDEDVQNLIAENLQRPPMLDTETGLQTAQKVFEIADSNNIESALVGGVAMYLYGSDRLTKDIDFIANQRLPLEATRFLSFGGERYAVKIGEKTIDVDWIVRRDNYKDFYKQALADAVTLSNGIRIISAEWLTILKYIAGRGKDDLDAIWLLQQSGLVNRRQIKQNLIKVAGETFGDIIFRELNKRYFYLADNQTDGDENESYESTNDYPEYNA